MRAALGRAADMEEELGMGRSRRVTAGAVAVSHALVTWGGRAGVTRPVYSELACDGDGDVRLG